MIDREFYRVFENGIERKSFAELRNEVTRKMADEEDEKEEKDPNKERKRRM